MILYLSDSNYGTVSLRTDPNRVQRNLPLRRLPGMLTVLLPVILARLPLIPLEF